MLVVFPTPLTPAGEDDGDGFVGLCDPLFEVELSDGDHVEKGASKRRFDEFAGRLDLFAGLTEHLLADGIEDGCAATLISTSLSKRAISRSHSGSSRSSSSIMMRPVANAFARWKVLGSLSSASASSSSSAAESTSVGDSAATTSSLSGRSVLGGLGGGALAPVSASSCPALRGLLGVLLDVFPEPGELVFQSVEHGRSLLLVALALLHLLHLLLLHLLLHLLGLLFELLTLGLELVNLFLRLLDAVVERVALATEHVDGVLLALLGGSSCHRVRR